ncbi:hypothetical protein CDL15_Pgr011705 [Punica granatum]|uniref:Uncharacterized protein n=1 Tax=Punica granatum TaxID=22663 RepID=A0A218WX83_PUNGR|nr:hypothetical protein CDL15_Pgr011705 [Punica granatum]
MGKATQGGPMDLNRAKLAQLGPNRLNQALVGCRAITMGLTRPEKPTWVQKWLQLGNSEKGSSDPATAGSLGRSSSSGRNLHKRKGCTQQQQYKEQKHNSDFWGKKKGGSSSLTWGITIRGSSSGARRGLDSNSSMEEQVGAAGTNRKWLDSGSGKAGTPWLSPGKEGQRQNSNREQLPKRFRKVVKSREEGKEKNEGADGDGTKREEEEEEKKEAAGDGKAEAEEEDDHDDPGKEK